MGTLLISVNKKCGVAQFGEGTNQANTVCRASSTHQNEVHIKSAHGLLKHLLR